MGVQSPQVQPQVQQVQPQAAVPAAQASQIVAPGVQVRTFGAKDMCADRCMSTLCGAGFQAHCDKSLVA